MNNLHLNIAKIDFSCPFCKQGYLDINGKYLDRCNKNQSFTTRIKCTCGNWFGMCYEYTGQAVGFDPKKKGNKSNIEI